MNRGERLLFSSLSLNSFFFFFITERRPRSLSSNVSEPFKPLTGRTHPICIHTGAPCVECSLNRLVSFHRLHPAWVDEILTKRLFSKLCLEGKFTLWQLVLRAWRIWIQIPRNQEMWPQQAADSMSDVWSCEGKRFKMNESESFVVVQSS